MKKMCEVGFLIALAAAGAAVGLWATSGGWSGPQAAEAQTKQGAGYLDVGYKEVRCVQAMKLDAVIITKVTVAGQEVQCGLRLGPENKQTITPFQAGDDWVSQMDIYLLNRTDKTIVFADVPLGFPDTGNGHTEPQVLYGMHFGRKPDAYWHWIGRPRGIDPKLKSAAFAPGQTFVLHVADYVDAIRARVEQVTPLFLVTKVDVLLGNFYFDDGMYWQAGGGFYVPDPGRPGKYKQLDPGRFFPGRSSRNWPPPR
jgi:hypothetical protein